MQSEDYGLSRRALLTTSAAAGLAASFAPRAVAAPVGLAGKAILITGCSSGFGRLTALHCARLGGTVVASMRNLNGGRRPEAVELADIASKERLKLHIVEIDVTKPEHAASGVLAAERIAGRGLDALVNNAGIGIAGPLEMFDESALRLIFETNLFGYLRMARAALPGMRARKQGVVVNLSSQLGRIVIPLFGPYSGTKFGVEAMFESLAYELAPHGVEVSIVQPGGYPTKIWENGRRLTDDLIARTGAPAQSAYAEQLELARSLLAGGGPTDPMDVANAIAEIIASPVGSRPLRRPVHPDTKVTNAVNAVCTQAQAAALAGDPFAQWYKAVTT